MSKSKKYFYISLLLIIIRFCFNTHNPLLNQLFASIVKLILVCSIVNAIILILATHFADKSIKNLPERRDWIHKASHILPIILLFVIIAHIISALFTFGIV
ncbi:hypothetical protein QUH70_08010 [Staphylococcus felis]|uniref:hypothetical protein n=1 Tax=Staphylococcus felis TaxID=46127 RepID=UPI0025A46C15|nr:hypothetical protein [Staphylococcus felis]MDM8328102.1 hypothetical protein [Staphylococcus felis]